MRSITKASALDVLLLMLEPEPVLLDCAVVPVMTMGIVGAVDALVGVMVRTSILELLGKVLTKV